MQIHRRDKLLSFTNISLHVVLTIPFVILTTLVVGSVGYLSYRNGQQAVNKVASQLRSEVTSRIEDHLEHFLAAPHQINQINANAIRQGLPSADDPDALARYLWEQIRVFDSVTSIYFGNPAGGLVDAGREGPLGSFYVIMTDEFRSGPFRKFATDSTGNRTNLLAAVPDFDARTRSWYTGAVAADDATWSDIYILFTGQDMALSASRPVYNEQQELLGVVANDIFLSHINSFLKHLTIGETGSSFIIERSGLLVASSSEEQPFTEQGRLVATESTIPSIRYAAEFLIEEFGSYDNITGEHQLEFNTAGQPQFLQVTPIQDKFGIDWLVVVTIPESDFMTQIVASNRTTIFLVSLALLFSVTAGTLIAQRISRPISRLNASVQAVAQGDWDQVVRGTRIRETGELAQSFNHMVAQLKQTIGSLKAENIERQKAENALRESEERFRTLVEDSIEGTLVHRNTKPLFANRAYARILGYASPEEILAMDSVVPLIAPHERERLLNYHSARINGQSAPSQYEYEAVCKDDSLITLQQLVTTIPWDGKPAVLATIIDTTERKHAEEALRQSKQLLEETLAKLKETQEQMMHQERMATVGQLAAGIAHDFNNILAAITLYTELSLHTDMLSAGTRKNLNVIAQQAERATNLVQQILDFGRRSIIERQPLAVDSLLKEITKLLGRTLPENVQIDLIIEPGTYYIHADPTRVQQAIINLALNARDAMPEGGHIHIKLTRIAGGKINCVDCGPIAGGDWVQLTVQDTGTGILPDVLPHVFEPFFTTRSPIGHGLGLAQVYGIVKQHEGHIEVETSAGQGTTFRLNWPALPVTQQETQTRRVLVTSQGNGQTILVVEDNETTRTALMDVLEMLGYRPLAAANGQEALAVCIQHKDEISLILTDWIMPAMSGLELVRQLEARHIAARVLVLTGHPLDEGAQKVMQERVTGWLQKPPSLNNLAEAVARALTLRVDFVPPA